MPYRLRPKPTKIQKIDWESPGWCWGVPEKVPPAPLWLEKYEWESMGSNRWDLVVPGGRRCGNRPFPCFFWFFLDRAFVVCLSCPYERFCPCLCPCLCPPTRSRHGKRWHIDSCQNYFSDYFVNIRVRSLLHCEVWFLFFDYFIQRPCVSNNKREGVHSM